MEADASESGPVEEAAEAAGEVSRVEGPPCGRGEDEAVVSPVWPCGLALCVLPFLVFLEGVEAFGRERDTAFGRPGLGGEMGEAAGSGALRLELEPTPVEGCAGCAELANVRDRARVVGDMTTVSDCNVYMRRHPEGHQ